MILIIGGSGFLGRHFRDLLSSKGEKNVIVTRNVARAREYSAPGEQFVGAEDFDGKLAENIVSDASAIVYLATSSTPSTFADRSWLEIPQVVAPISEFMLKFASVNPNAKRIFVSSGGTIYGNPCAGAVDEDQPIAPISAYGLGKQMVEQAVQFAGRAYGLNYNILRVSNPIGRHHQNASQGVVPAAIRSLLAGTEFTLFGDGSSVRDYIDADDVAEAIWGACRDKQFNDRIWNIGSGVGRSLQEILALVDAVAERKLKVRRIPSRKIDVKRIVLNCERVAADIGWFPKRDIARTIADMWKAQSRHASRQESLKAVAV
jgi:UDP-glucose 4-epimerase